MVEGWEECDDEVDDSASRVSGSDERLAHEDCVEVEVGARLVLDCEYEYAECGVVAKRKSLLDF